MSRLADLLNGSTGDANPSLVTQTQLSAQSTLQSPQHRPTSLNSPLEALTIEGEQSKMERQPGQQLLGAEEKDLDRPQSTDKEGHSVVESRANPINEKSPALTSVEVIHSENATGTKDQRLGQQANELKIEANAGDAPIHAHQHIKKEESQGPVPLQEIPSPAPMSSMPPKGPPKKKPTTNGPKRPAKKRKLDSRADTPQSQRSGTPNSVLGARSGPKTKKQHSPTPLHSSPGLEDEDGDDDESDDGLYCICRKGDDHTWMIACDGGCDDWFHGRCIGIDQRDGNLIDKFICPNCSDSKGAETTWKPMCRLDGCREPAAINAAQPSKYCCDDHAAQFFRRFIKKGLGVDALSSAKKRRKENLTENFQSHKEDFDQPAHLRGGLLSPAELKTITNGLQTCKEFRSLGESIPMTEKDAPNADSMETDIGNKTYMTHELDQLKATTSRTEILRHRLKIFEDRERFLGLVKSRAKAVLEEFKKKDKTMKDMCGFDRRLRWSDEDFDTWCHSDDGKEAFKSSKLKPDLIDGDGDSVMEDTDELGKGMCLRKRCKQHEGWYKLHSMEFAYGKADVSREMSRVAGEEQDIRERATIRNLEAKAASSEKNS